MHKLTDLGGFGPHIDANAYTRVKNISHLTVLAAVDDEYRERWEHRKFKVSAILLVSKIEN